MVNVNKNIVPGKPVESSAKSKAPARRPRNQELNSSKKQSGQDRLAALRKQKLNCSAGNIPAGYEQYYQVISEQEFADTVGSEVDNLRSIVSDIEDEYGEKIVGYITAKPEYADVFVDANIDSGFITASGKILNGVDDGYINLEEAEQASGRTFNSSTCSDNTADESLNSSEITEDDFEYDEDGSGISTKDYMGYTIYKSIPDEDSGSVGYMVYDGDYPQSFDTLEECKEFIRDTLNSSKALNCSSEEPEGDADGGESVAEGVDASDIKITTESGNEVSMQDIKIVQNPDTNELAIFIPEDEEETIPEGFSVIGMVVPDTLDSAPAIEGGDVCPECGQDPCVCEDDGELDSSKKKSELNCSSSSGLLGVATEYYEDEHDALVDILQSVDNLGYGDAVYEQLIKNYGYEGTDAQQADEALIKMASEDADEHDFLVSLIQAIEDLGYGKQVYTDVLRIGSDIDSSLNCDSSSDDYFAALWSAYTDDDYKCACCGKSFPAGHNSVQLDGHKPDGMHFIYKYTKDNRVGNSVNYDPYNLPPEDSEGGIFKVVVGEEADDEGYRWLNFCRNCWPKLTSKSPEEIYNEYSIAESQNDLTQESVNSSLGGGDDRQDATSQVTVPKSFPDDKVHDLYRWVENELLHEGIDVDVYGVGRPSASTISFEFEVTGRDPSEVDAIIEDRVKEFIANGNNAIQYPEGDPRSELNSDKQEKNLNCTVENARVEPTEQGTWVVKADTDRFGKDAILYEHYSEEGANKYLDRLKAGGDAVANGYDGHIDPKKVDLDSGNGIAEAKLNKASISKAMSKVLTEDKDTPLVSINLKDGILVYLQPASYDDNRLIEDGNFDEAKIYVAMYDENFNPIMVNDRRENKMNGSEVVDYIKHNLGM